MRVDWMTEEMLDIADDATNDWELDRDGNPKKLDREAVGRSKLRLEARQWLAERLDPQQWGERQQIDMKADMLLQMPEEQRVKKALELLDMVREVVNRPKGPRPIVYNSEDGDVLAEEERRQRLLEQQEDDGGIGR
jgi:terminase small subunit-like protein